MTRSNESFEKGSADASATRKETLPSGSRPIRFDARLIIGSEISTPLTLQRGNSRATKSAATPVPVPRSKAFSGTPISVRAVASGNRIYGSDSTVRASQLSALMSKKRFTGPRIAGHSHGARSMALPIP